MKNKKTKLLLIRHGQSTSNAEHRWQGQGNSPLSNHGKKQAKWLAKRLNSSQIDRVISSDLDRAKNTAEALEIPVSTDPRLREINVGDWEGRLKTDVAKMFADQIQALAHNESIQIGGGESWLDVYARVDQAMQDILHTQKPETTTAVFAHGGVIHSYLRGLLNLRNQNARRLGWLANTSVTSLELVEDKLQIESFNDTVHLAKYQGWHKGIPLDQGSVMAIYASEPSTTPPSTGQKTPPDWYSSPSTIFSSNLAQHPKSELEFTELLGKPINQVNHSTENLVQKQLQDLSEHVKPQHVGWIMPPQQKKDLINKLTKQKEKSSLFLSPRGYSASHIVSSQKGTFLADYNISLLE